MFDHYIGVNYSGEKAPVSRIPGLQLFASTPASNPSLLAVPSVGARNWSRKDLAAWCIRSLLSEGRGIIGFGHGFSFPASYMRRHELKTWSRFLGHFAQAWPTNRDHMYVDFARANCPPGGSPEELRLCERWVASAHGVFDFERAEAAAKASRAGIVWLWEMRQHPGFLDKVHFWPFDGFEVPEDKSVVAEVFPALFRHRYPREARGEAEHNAFSTSMWLKQMDGRGALRQYLNPPLTLPERRLADIEGWMLGVY